MYLPLIVLFFRLSEAGLVAIGRLAESGSVKLDRSLLTALVDRWRPETNTFHLPCGEMTPTLQDIAILLGLPISGDAVGPRVVPLSHPVYEGKPNASHMCARISLHTYD